MKRICINGNEIEIEANGRDLVTVSIRADLDTVVEELTVKEICDHVDMEDLLNEIGIDRVKEHFDLVESEQATA